MSPKTLRIALAGSVALNVFALAAGGALYVTRNKVEARVAEQSQPPRGRPLTEMLAEVDPDVRARVRDHMRVSALAAQPDFEAARQARRRAVELSQTEDFDAEEVRALLERSRQAELRGRTRLEGDAVTLLQTLDTDDRRALSRVLTRGGRRASKEPQAAPPAPQAAS